MEKPHILCIGDLMLDRFFYGTVDRISPEAPVPVLHIQRMYETLGGAGNVVRNLTALGSRVSFLSCVGDDFYGRQICQLLEDLPDVEFSLMTHGKTTTKTRYSAQGQQILRSDDELILPLDATEENHLIEKINVILPTVDLVVLSDYKKGLLTPKACQHIIRSARVLSIPVIVDPKGKDYTAYAGATIITPNVKELSEATGHPIHQTHHLDLAAQELIARHQLGAVLITRSEKGMTLVQKTAPTLHIPAKAQDVYDVSGAGDTVVATLAVGMAHKMSLEEATKLSNFAASLVVSKAGTAVVTWEELQAFISSEHRDDLDSSKHVSLPALYDLVHKWKAAHLKVGLTNGCFDLLHLGHLHILKEAKKACDRLIVAVNTDYSIKRLKGSGRPIQSEIVRAELLSALEVVDAVILFGEDTPLSLIQRLLPDVLVKGADYTIETVVGSDLVLKNGGDIVLVPLLEDHSTTNTIIKMAFKKV